ncbi:MAG: pilin assembly protein [Neisseria sp.]|jgi:pilP|uniref:Pilus assembly protein PilP n=1 Tax=Kingella pumchi TaxID=2779506 RepID=A0ABS9NS26_9NEIS|nr:MULTISPECIES: pilus assembly protein PilP [Kingella]MCG6504941.1 pilus assembly protein PilP [Kingella pumchi]MDD2182911.1 pilus assembly protein PilP [Kingella sp. SNUBH-2017]RKV86100.1 MAG: pilin assembly protein [Neisseria sp.]
MKVRLLLASLFILSACSGEHDDLNSWMQQTRQEAKSKIRPPEPVAPVERVTYFPPQFSGPNAYSVQRMKAAYQNSNAPDLNRPKELLENYSLENLKYVGSIGTARSLSALIEVDGHVYTVTPGKHLGQNFGRVSRITPDKIDIVEVVEDTFGNWVNRPAELLLSTGDAQSSNQATK